ncbi:MAG: RsmG family class I SAM-dependent methyltransferase [Actinomycetota bacterium]
MAAHPLDDVLDAARRRGMIGGAPNADVIDHARRFVVALADVQGAVLDLGSGAGLPGLVIASDRPDLDVTLLDRRRKRTDFLEQMVRRLGWSDRVSVVAAEAEEFVGGAAAARFSAAVARGFGPPEWVLGVATCAVHIDGLVVVSDPPNGDRWTSIELTHPGVRRRELGIRGVSVFQRVE